MELSILLQILVSCFQVKILVGQTNCLETVIVPRFEYCFQTSREPYNLWNIKSVG
jgi:hypothetical protein